MTDTILDHAILKNNPHQTTKEQVGLGNVENYEFATREEILKLEANDKYINPANIDWVRESFSNYMHELGVLDTGEENLFYDTDRNAWYYDAGVMDGEFEIPPAFTLFDELNSGVPNYVNQVVANGDLVAAATIYGIYLSHNGGTSWTRLVHPHGNTNMSRELFIIGNIIYAVQSYVLLKIEVINPSTINVTKLYDTGTNSITDRVWVYDSGSTRILYLGIAPYGGTTFNIAYSSNDGASWVTRTAPIPGNAIQHINGAGADIWVRGYSTTGVNANIVRSTNSGINWNTPIDLGYADSVTGDAPGLSVSPGNRNHIIATANWMFFVSDDGGSTWLHILTGGNMTNFNPSQSGVYTIYGVYRDDNVIISGVSKNDLCISMDKGVSGSWVNYNHINSAMPNISGGIKKIFVDKNNSNTIWCATSEGVLKVTNVL